MLSATESAMCSLVMTPSQRQAGARRRPLALVIHPPYAGIVPLRHARASTSNHRDVLFARHRVVALLPISPTVKPCSTSSSPRRSQQRRVDAQATPRRRMRSPVGHHDLSCFMRPSWPPWRRNVSSRVSFGSIMTSRSITSPARRTRNMLACSALGTKCFRPTSFTV